jgi:hypothetical protein
VVLLKQVKVLITNVKKSTKRITLRMSINKLP